MLKKIALQEMLNQKSNIFSASKMRSKMMVQFKHFNKTTSINI
jgi:hypothetical protein